MSRRTGEPGNSEQAEQVEQVEKAEKAGTTVRTGYRPEGIDDAFSAGDGPGERTPSGGKGGAGGDGGPALPSEPKCHVAPRTARPVHPRPLRWRLGQRLDVGRWH